MHEHPKAKLENALKKIKDKTKIDIRYCLIAPYAFVHIHWDPAIYEVVYEIEEPILNELENLIEKRSIQYLMNDLCESIKNLSFFQRYLYIEHFQKGLPILKISKELGVPNTTVWKEYRKMKDISSNLIALDPRGEVIIQFRALDLVFYLHRSVRLEVDCQRRGIRARFGDVLQILQRESRFGWVRGRQFDKRWRVLFLLH